MTRLDLQKYRTEQRYRLAFYLCGLAAAVILALVGSEYAGEAFSLIGGLIGGDALNNKLRN